MVKRVIGILMIVGFLACSGRDESDEPFSGDSILSNTAWRQLFYSYGQTGSIYLDIYAGGQRGILYEPTKDSCYQAYLVTITKNGLFFDSTNHNYTIANGSRHPLFLNVYFPCIAFDETTTCAESFERVNLDTVYIKLCNN